MSKTANRLFVFLRCFFCFTPVCLSMPEHDVYHGSYRRQKAHRTCCSHIHSDHQSRVRRSEASFLLCVCSVKVCEMYWNWGGAGTGILHTCCQVLFFCHMCRSIFFTFSQNSELNLSVIGPYIDYLKEKQSVNNVFGKFTCGFFLFIFVFFLYPTWINSNIAWFIRWFVDILLFYCGRYVAPLLITLTLFPGVKII